MKKIAVFWAIVILFLMTTLSGPVFGETESDNSLLENNYLDLEDPQINQTEPQPVHLNFYGGDGGELKPEDPQGNQTTEVPCPGSPLPRAFGLLVGIWTTPKISAAISVEASISVSIWAKSDQAANNVHFTVQILVNGGQIMDDIETNSQSLSGTPSEFIGDGSGSQIELNAGDTIAARLYYFADSQVVIGPAPDSIMLVGGSEYNTHITITTAPISISVNEPLVDANVVTFSATYLDAFASNNLMAHIMVDGKSDVKALSEPAFSPGNNGSLVSWTWDYKTDKGKDGEYTIKISVHYCHENDFSAIGIYMVEFPRAEEDEGFLGSIGWILHPILLVIAIVAAIIIVRKILERRTEKSPT